jgi:hypothetical protein
MVMVLPMRGVRLEALGVQLLAERGPSGCGRDGLRLCRLVGGRRNAIYGGDRHVAHP